MRLYQYDCNGVPRHCGLYPTLTAGLNAILQVPVRSVSRAHLYDDYGRVQAIGAWIDLPNKSIWRVTTRQQLRRRATRRAREQALRDLGLRRVRGNMGTVYWE